MANAHDLLMAQRAAMMGGKSLPYDYRVEYITSENAVYASSSDYRFETSMKRIGPNTRFVIKMLFTKYASPAAQIGTEFPTIGFCGADNRSLSNIGSGMRLNNVVVAAGGNRLNEVHTYDFNFRDSVYVLDDGSPVQIASISDSVSTIGYALFARVSFAGVVIARMFGRTYSFEAWEGQVKTHDYIPVVKNGRLSFYNMIDGEFIYGLGKDVFEAGPRV